MPNDDRHTDTVKISASDSLVATAFHQSIATLCLDVTVCDVSVEDGKEKIDPIGYGTGFIVGSVSNPSGPPRPIIATAAHVLAAPVKGRVGYRVVRHSAAGERISDFFEATQRGVFSQYFDSMSAFRGLGDLVDVGFITAPIGSRLLRDDPELIRFRQSDMAVAEGSHVAWAGFPQLARDLTGGSRLCYFEGVVSHVVVDEDGPPLYLLDGAASQGVSGGPLWYCDSSSSAPEFVGTITHYREPGTAHRQLGFVVATSSRVLLGRFRSLVAATREHPER